MHINFPRYLSWRVYFTDKNPFSPLGKETIKRIKKTFERIEKLDYYFAEEEVTDQYLDRFVPLYEAHISAKERGTVFRVRDRIRSNTSDTQSYHALSLYHKDILVGANIFFIDTKTNEAAIAYGVFPHEIEASLLVGLSCLGDYLVYKYIVERGFSELSYGIDRNIYGYHSAIGLPCYKMRMGALPFLPATHPATGNSNEILDSIPTFADDMLIFLGDAHEKLSTQALFISEKSEKDLKNKFPILFSSSFFKTTIISHSEIPPNSEWK